MTVPRDGVLPPLRSTDLGHQRVDRVEVGDASGPPAVLLAGLSDGLAPASDPRTRGMLAAVPLPMETFRGIALSYPTPLETPVTTRELADSVARTLRQLIDEPAVVVGHSLGAMVAQHLAADAPELVRALILSAPIGRADDALRAILRRWDQWLEGGDVAAFHRDALETSFTGEERERRRAQLDGEPAPVASSRVARHLALSGAGATHDAVGRLRDIAAPSLLLAGSDDEVAPPRHAEQVAAAVPGAQLVVVGDAGHAFPEQYPERFARLVAAFLRDHDLEPPPGASIAS